MGSPHTHALDILPPAQNGGVLGYLLLQTCSHYLTYESNLLSGPALIGSEGLCLISCASHASFTEAEQHTSQFPVLPFIAETLC